MDWFDSREDMAEHIAKKDEHVNPAMTSATALRIEIEHAMRAGTKLGHSAPRERDAAAE